MLPNRKLTERDRLEDTSDTRFAFAGRMEDQMAKKKVVRKTTPAKKGPKPGSVRLSSVEVAAQWKDTKEAMKEAERLAEKFGASVGAIKLALRMEWPGSQYRETFKTRQRNIVFKLTPEQLCEELNKDDKIKETATRTKIGYQTMNNWIKKWKEAGVIGNPWVVLKK